MLLLGLDGMADVIAEKVIKLIARRLQTSWYGVIAISTAPPPLFPASLGAWELDSILDVYPRWPA